MTRCPTDPDRAGGRLALVDDPASVNATTDQLWSGITGIGGSNGWYSWRLGW